MLKMRAEKRFAEEVSRWDALLNVHLWKPSLGVNYFHSSCRVIGHALVNPGCEWDAVTPKVKGQACFWELWNHLSLSSGHRVQSFHSRSVGLFSADAARADLEYWVQVISGNVST